MALSVAPAAGASSHNSQMMMDEGKMMSEGQTSGNQMMMENGQMMMGSGGASGLPQTGGPALLPLAGGAAAMLVAGGGLVALRSRNSR